MAPPAVQRARAFHLIELTPNARHPVADEPSVGLNLRFTRPAEEAEAASLPLQVSPGPNETTGLIIQVGQFDLQSSFGGSRPLPKDLEDQAGSVDDLRLDLLLQRLLLNRRQRCIHDEQFGIVFASKFRDLFDLPFAQQSRRSDLPKAKSLARHHVDANRSGEAFRFFESGLRRAPGPLPDLLGNHDDRPLAASNIILGVVESQSPGSSPA